MKFGFNLLLFTTFVEERDAPLFEWLARLGYDGVEIPSGDGPVDHYPTVRKYADDAGLACTAIAMATPAANPTSADPAIRNAALDRLRERIEVAHVLGSPVLGGPLYSAHKHFEDPPPDGDAMARAAEVLAQAGEIADAAGVTLAIEPLNRFEAQLVNCADEARRLVDLAAHPRVAIHYDTHHAHIEERSHEAAIATCGDRLAHVHASESHRGTLGTGLVDWDAVATGLRAVGYDGWCTIEAFGTQVDGLRQAANVFRDCYTSREEVVEQGLPFLREHFGA